MRIRIYQITSKEYFRDCAFLSYKAMLDITRKKYIDKTIYCEVYEGDVAAEDLEDVYFIFNMAHPQDYKARSLSMSDVVELVDEGKFYYCDRVGFKEIEFRGEKNGR